MYYLNKTVLGHNLELIRSTIYSSEVWIFSQIQKGNAKTPLIATSTAMR